MSRSGTIKVKLGWLENRALRAAFF